jgi:hypothetical protein
MCLSQRQVHSPPIGRRAEMMRRRIRRRRLLNSRPVVFSILTGLRMESSYCSRVMTPAAMSS